MVICFFIVKIKFNIGKDIKLVLMDDGIEVDEEYFEEVFCNIILMIFKIGEVWGKGK